MVLFPWLGDGLRFGVQENPLLIAPDGLLRYKYICVYVFVLHNTHERVALCINLTNLVCFQRIFKSHIHSLPLSN